MLFGALLSTSGSIPNSFINRFANTCMSKNCFQKSVRKTWKFLEFQVELLLRIKAGQKRPVAG